VTPPACPSRCTRGPQARGRFHRGRSCRRQCRKGRCPCPSSSRLDGKLVMPWLRHWAPERPLCQRLAFAAPAMPHNSLNPGPDNEWVCEYFAYHRQPPVDEIQPSIFNVQPPRLRLPARGEYVFNGKIDAFLRVDPSHFVSRPRLRLEMKSRRGLFPSYRGEACTMDLSLHEESSVTFGDRAFLAIREAKSSSSSNMSRVARRKSILWVVTSAPSEGGSSLMNLRHPDSARACHAGQN